MPTVRSSVQTLLAKLDKVSGRDGQWSACCPAHDDTRPSLSISQGADSRVLLYCHAGCTHEEICQAVGLTIADLYLQSGESPVPNSSLRTTFSSAKAALADLERRFDVPRAYWQYHDRNGVLVGLVARWGCGKDKTYRPISLIDGSWVNAGMPEPRPLYALPELAEAEHAYVVEGEKCAAWLRSLGLVATTCAHGARSPGKSDWSSLSGKKVTILPDHDEAGEGFAAAVVQLLAKLADPPKVQTVRLPGLMKGGDVFDWGMAQGSVSHKVIRSRLLTLVKETALPAQCRDAPSMAPSPLVLGSDAHYGLTGEFVALVSPHSEADEAALALHFLVAAGSVVGRRPYFPIEGDRHHANLYAVFVGSSSAGRKGVAYGRSLELMQLVDPTWASENVRSGLSSGEGLIHTVRDAAEYSNVKGKGSKKDPGVPDKRLLVREAEFSSVLKQFERQGNILSQVVRQGWDSGNLRILTKLSPVSATNAHISIAGDITAPELQRYLTSIDIQNGVFNRFLVAAVKRSKCLPLGGNEVSLEPLARQVRSALRQSQCTQQMTFSRKAKTTWIEVYPDLTAGGDGLIAAACARAAPQVLRLALIYALLDKSEVINKVHLLAALAMWKYCEASVRFIFGDKYGDPVADKILAALRAAPEGLTRTQISDLFKRNLDAPTLTAALEQLRRSGKAWSEKRDNREIWHASA